MPRKISSNSFRNLSGKAKGRPTPVVDLSDADCLCLVCRQTGHVVEWCPWFLQWKNRGGGQDASMLPTIRFSASAEWEDTYSDEEGDPDRDPILLLAKEMFGESPAVPPSVDRGELLIEGIGLTFKLRLSLFEDRPEIDRAECSVILKGIPGRHRLTFHEHNAGDLMRERSGKTQEFLLLSCAATAHPSKYTRCALLLVDCEGMTATRVAVVTLELEDYEFLAGANPQRKFYKLK